ncbi:MAG: AMP-binding protein, partial [Firmicutes bacterium]|nr:AMP-binding protein [Bacillota bacterium]
MSGSDPSVRMPDWLFQRRDESQWAVIHPDGRFSYSQLYQHAADFAAMLQERGVQAGDRVAILARHALVYAVTLHAARFVQAILVPLNTRLSAVEIAWQVEDAEAHYIVCDSLHLALWQDAQKLTGRSLDVSIQDGLHWPQVQHSLTPPWIELERVQSLMYTSGTTGKPKGAMITYGNHFYGATASAFG